MESIPYILERARRRSVGIWVTEASEVVVRAPHRLSVSEIEKIVQKKSAWILDRKSYFASLQERFPKKQFISGELFPFLGSFLQLDVRFSPQKRVRIENEGDRLVAWGSEATADRIQTAILRFYQKEALKVLTERVGFFAQIMRLNPRSIRVRNQKRRWGSCSSKAALSFNWRLVLMPLDILDYVVIHELCHIPHPNHSPRFWKLVEEFAADYKTKRAWLRDESDPYVHPFTF